MDDTVLRHQLDLDQRNSVNAETITATDIVFSNDDLLEPTFFESWNDPETEDKFFSEEEFLLLETL